MIIKKNVPITDEMIDCYTKIKLIRNKTSTNEGKCRPSQQQQKKNSKNREIKRNGKKIKIISGDDVLCSPISDKRLC